METNKKKKFKLFDLNRDGKGAVEESRKPTLGFFFKLFWRKLPNLLQLNLLMIFQVIPVLAVVGVYLLGEKSPSATNVLFAPLYGINKISASPDVLPSLDLSSIQMGFPVFSPVVTYTIIILFVFLLITWGWQNVGATYILRGLVRGDAVFTFSDFFYAIKKNLKQGFFLGLIDFTVIAVLTIDFIFFYTKTGSFGFDFMYFMIFALATIYFIMRFYIYLLLVTFDLKNFKIIKNSLIFSVLGIKRNIMALLGIVLLVVLHIALTMLLLPIGISLPLILPVVYAMATTAFMSAYAAYPIIDKYMIAPYASDKEDEDFVYLKESNDDDKADVEESMDVNCFDVFEYDLKKYIYPIWANDVSYAENVFVAEYTETSNLEFQLLFPVDEVISVRSADLQTLYTQGEDYEITSNGNIKISKAGRIPILEYSKYRFPYDYEKTPEAFPERNADGTGFTGYGFFYEEVGGTTVPGMSRYSIAVTYKHSAKSTISVPESKSAGFKNIIKKAKAGQDIKIVSIGDSITDGWSSSGRVNMLPKCPPYAYLVEEYIKATYGADVTHINLAYSGKSSRWALKKCDDRGYVPIDEVCKNNPDLVILAFGMNDGCSVEPERFIGNINSMLDTIKNNCPQTSVVVVGSALPNPEISWKQEADKPNPGPILKYHIDYEPVLCDAEKSWSNAKFANVTKTHMEMISSNRYSLTGRKRYEDTAGSNSNHPNDYFHRVYAQVIIQTIFGEIK